MASAFSTAVALRGEQSGGAISVIENALPARWDGPPLHQQGVEAPDWALEPAPPVTTVGSQIGCEAPS